MRSRKKKRASGKIKVDGFFGEMGVKRKKNERWWRKEGDGKRRWRK